MQISRRALMMGLSTAPLAACVQVFDNTEVGSGADEGGFGNPTMHNLLIQTGQMPYVMDLAERFAAEVPTTVTFEFDSATLDAEAQAILRRQAGWISQFPEVTFRVFGHTDLVGSAAYNHRLGMRRARAVVNYLVRHGASRSRLEAVVSHGETRPLLQTTERERQNRRTVTEVSGFWQQSPMVQSGEYARIVYRGYITQAGGT